MIDTPSCAVLGLAGVSLARVGRNYRTGLTPRR